MNKISVSKWIVWGVLLVAFILVALLLVPAYSACYFTVCLATLLTFALVAGVFVKASKTGDAISSIVGQPISQVAIGVLFLQLIAGVVFVLLSDRCHWLIPACVECVILCVAAAALTVKDSQTDNPAVSAADAVKDEQAT